MCITMYNYTDIDMSVDQNLVIIYVIVRLYACIFNIYRHSGRIITIHHLE